MLLQAESLAYEPTNAVAFDGVADAARRDRQPQARVSERIRRGNTLE